ncbi:MAG: ABC transporter permease [Nisaea sp.]|jgi:ABC-2 type transport system permease protein|nr:ABC transporter permease [Nisaea sp.]MDA8575399.1 ABC transporter permease [Alphaproteobacteria bacterium]OUX93969.1 MAG: ABC transporter permease [Candidatus Endolissoclinum sp. TMED26]
MRNIGLIFRRELAAYFATPLAYIFIIIFLVLAGTLTFFVGSFMERDQADLQAFFSFHPWLYLFLVPALSMRLWAEERRTGSIELLLTMPITMTQAVLGKYLAAWVFTGIALALTAPIWLTVNYLGDPDNGVIVASYVASFLMAGAFMAIGSMISASTKNQVIAFVLTTTICFVLTLAGSPIVIEFFANWAPPMLIELVNGLGFLSHFQAIQRGVIDFRDFIYFASIIGLALYANALILDLEKAA